MAIDTPAIVIVGCGPGAAEYVTEAARRAAAEADVLVGSPRLLAMVGDGTAERVAVDAHIAPLLAKLAELRAAGRRIAVLVSGDPGLFSLGQTLVRHFGREACEVVPGVSSVQVAFSRLGLDWSDARVASAHGRAPTAGAAELAGSDKVALLAGTADALRWAAGVVGALAASHEAFLCENLTLAGEQVRQVTAAELSDGRAGSLSIILLVRKGIVA
jgi:cobalt-precorrin-7 (C5)-methyltransferase